MKTVRRNIRIKAFQALFQLAQSPRQTVDEAVAFSIRYPLEEIEEELSDVEALRLNFPEQDLTDEVVQELLDYLNRVAAGVTENKKY